MDQLQDQNSRELNHCRYDNDNSNYNERLTEYLELDNREDDPLGEPEVTVNLYEGSMRLMVEPLEELEEDLFDDEADVSIEERNTEFEEQVVPSSQLSNSYKYPEELSISDDEVDEGIFEDDPASYDWALPEDNRYDSQPP